MCSEDLRLWVQQHKLAARREATEARAHVPSPSEAFENGLAMISFVAQTCGWPLPEDERDIRQDFEAYERWARLRTRVMP